MGLGSSKPIDLQVPSFYPGAPYVFSPETSRVNFCEVKAPDDGSDAAPLIEYILNNDCRQNAKVVLPSENYNMSSVMNTTTLDNVELQIMGNLTWSTDAAYWLNNSLRVGYQNQSTAWQFGGNNVWVHGEDDATFNGNGQFWYDNYGPHNNYPGRPHAITFRGLNNSVVEGLRFWQSQMWTMSIIFSNNVLFQDIWINNTNTNPSGNSPKSSNQNTDGADTIFSNNITFARWTVDCGDDNIAAKANSTNILIRDSKFYKGLGVALGSIGQYKGQWTQISNLKAENISYHGTRQGAYIKTWTGVSMDAPPNGGGGGLGRIRNITFNDWTFEGVGSAFSATQCTAYLPWNYQRNCNTSLLQISDLNWGNIRGTIWSGEVADLECSGAAPCERVKIHNVNLTLAGKPIDKYRCRNVDKATSSGFTCVL